MSCFRVGRLQLVLLLCWLSPLCAQVTTSPDRRHPIMKGIEWSPSPIFNGYNCVSVKKAGKVLATFKERGDPLLVVWTFGKGRAMALTSDIAPHWGAGFHGWTYYEQFWSQAPDGLGSRRPSRYDSSVKYTEEEHETSAI